MGRMEGGDARVSLLIELQGDRPGALAAALRPFAEHGVGLTHIESRPRRAGAFDFFVDCEGGRDDPAVAAVINELRRIAGPVLVLDGREVPWFPRHIAELDRIANNTLDAGAALSADHPGFHDEEYRARRALVDGLARRHRHGGAFPRVCYSEAEHGVWRDVHAHLAPLVCSHACVEYRRALAALERHCGYRQGIPQGSEVSAFLETRTGFRLRPVAGLLRPRDFLAGLAFRVFFATQYIRHPSKPLYTPEPDVCHELIGHAPMFADPAFADLSQEIGLASLGASDADIERLARCYWYSVEFGLLREGGGRKAYGAGLLSSFGELEHACGADSPATFARWEPGIAAERPYPITQYQPHYFVADSLQDAKTRMRAFCEALPRPFHARFHPAAESIWVDRVVRRRRSPLEA